MTRRKAPADLKPRTGNKSPKRGTGEGDMNVAAFNIVQRATQQIEETLQKESAKNPAAVTLGRLGGLKGGRARAAKLTPEQRAEIAKKAAEKRWGKP